MLVVGMNDAGLVIAWNPSAEALFGWTREEAIGRRMGEMIVPDKHRDAHETGLQNFIATGQGPVLDRKIRLTAMRRMGGDFPVELGITAVRMPQTTLFFAFIRSLEEIEAVARERLLRQSLAETMAAISDAQVSMETSGEFVSFCLTRICETTRWPVGHYYTVDKLLNPMRLVATDKWHISDERYRPAIDASGNYSFEKGQGLPGAVWRTNDVVIFDVLEKEKRFRRRDIFTALGLSKGLAFPVRDRDGVTGVMEFFAPDTTPLQPELQLFARTIAGHIGATLQRRADAEAVEIQRKEMAHRVSNSFAILTSVFRRCYRNASSREELYKEFEPRLMAISRAHHGLDQPTTQSARLRAVAEQELAILPDADRITVEGDDLDLPEKAVLPITMVLHELVTNSLKYGSWHEDGHLSLRWSSPAPEVPGETRTVYFEWRESPSGTDKIADRDGYGTQLLKAMIEHSLGGTFKRRVKDGDFAFSAEFRI